MDAVFMILCAVAATWTLRAVCLTIVYIWRKATYL